MSDLIEKAIANFPNRPHLVILGAGASKDVMPNGDAYGKSLPLMGDFISTLGLTDYIGRIESVPKTDNIEEVYSWLSESGGYADELFIIENVIREYFTDIVLPLTLTKYDLLVLSLRKKDYIATFNWDGALVQSYMKMKRVTEDLPQMIFLHGNVEVGYCSECKTFGHYLAKCHKCGRKLQEVPLLYPVAHKKYRGEGFISEQWKILEKVVSEAALITIYGYSAPKTDVEAIDILKQSFARLGTPRFFDIIEIIERPDFDIKDISDAWLDLSAMAKDHIEIRHSVFDSFMFQNPRRSLDFICKNLFHSSWLVESSIKFTKADLDGDKDALGKKIAPLLINEQRCNYDVI